MIFNIPGIDPNRAAMHQTRTSSFLKQQPTTNRLEPKRFISTSLRFVSSLFGPGCAISWQELCQDLASNTVATSVDVLGVNCT
jgi:hypothetical protein